MVESTQPSLYHPDPTKEIHQGAIYRFRPIFWLTPPLWIARNLDFHTPAKADLVKWEDFPRAFHNSNDNQEFVLATAKIRYLIIISSTREARHPRYKDVRVAPIYTTEDKSPEFVDGLKTNQYDSLFYLTADQNFQGMVESYIDLRQVTALHKGFLGDGKLEFCITEETAKALLARYQQYVILNR